MIQPTNNWRQDEPYIFFMWKSIRTSRNGNQNVQTYNVTTENSENMSNTDPTKKNAGELRCKMWYTRRKTTNQKHKTICLFASQII